MTRRKAILSTLLAPFALKAVAKEASLKKVAPAWERHQIGRFDPNEYAGKWQFIVTTNPGWRNLDKTMWMELSSQQTYD
jgi:hypothetical protein